MWGCGRRLLRDERRGSRVQRYPPTDVGVTGRVG